MTRTHGSAESHPHRSRQGGKRTPIFGENEAKPKSNNPDAEGIGSVGCGLPFLAKIRLKHRLVSRPLIEFFIAPDSVVTDGARAD